METYQKHLSKLKLNFLLYHLPLTGFTQRPENKEIVIALNAIGADVAFVEIESDKGHDSFLLDVPEFLNTLKNYVNNSYSKN